MLKERPDIGAAVGKGIREFRRASTDIEDSIRGETKRAEGDERAATQQRRCLIHGGRGEQPCRHAPP